MSEERECLIRIWCSKDERADFRRYAGNHGNFREALKALLVIRFDVNENIFKEFWALSRDSGISQDKLLTHMINEYKNKKKFVGTFG